EFKKGVVRGVSLELIGKAKELAEKTQEKICVVLIGNHVSQFREEFSSHGIDQIFLCEDEILQEYLTETYTIILVELARKYLPNIILFPSTKIGRDLAPRIAATLNTGLTADCIDLDNPKYRTNSRLYRS
ncbi:MAG: electron transfer flavoprotein subunit alpha/FixB family protein, partial [Promethearchaeota archaeon]